MEMQLLEPQDDEISAKDKQDEHYINILVSRKRIEWIAFTYELSEHAMQRMAQRDEVADRDLKMAIRRSPLCWKQVDGTICIAFDLYSYIVVDDSSGKPAIITFINTKDYDCNVFDKMLVEYKKFIIEKHKKENK